MDADEARRRALTAAVKAAVHLIAMEPRGSFALDADEWASRSIGTDAFADTIVRQIEPVVADAVKEGEHETWIGRRDHDVTTCERCAADAAKAGS